MAARVVLDDIVALNIRIFKFGESFRLTFKTEKC